MGADDAGSGMQFEKAEMPGANAPPACSHCQRPLDEYFEIGGNLFCSPCADGVRRGGSFWRALLYGGGAALLGTIVWFAIMKIFNWELGIIGIVVGLAVGVAVRKGAQGLGGWKYQTLAMVLTYVSITASYVPLVLKGMAEAAEKGTAGDHASAAPAADEKAVPSGEGEPGAAGQAAPTAEKQGTPAPRPSGVWLAVAVVIAFARALVMPFLAGAENFIGLIIIGVALYEAWKINRRIPIQGPFRFGAPLSVPAPAPVTPGVPPPAPAT